MQRSLQKQEDHRCYREVCEAASLGASRPPHLVRTVCVCVDTPPPQTLMHTQTEEGAEFKSASVQG